MNIASPHLVQLHAPLGWPPRHLGGMTDGLATQDGAHGAAHRSSDRSPRVQLAIRADLRVGAWLSRRLGWASSSGARRRTRLSQGWPGRSRIARWSAHAGPARPEGKKAAGLLLAVGGAAGQAGLH